MEIRRDRYLNRLIDRMHNGMVKVVTGHPPLREDISAF